MPNYANQADAANLAFQSTFDREKEATYERSGMNLAELDRAIAGETRPDVRATLKQERVRQGGSMDSPSNNSATLPGAPTVHSQSTRTVSKLPGIDMETMSGDLGLRMKSQAEAMAGLQNALLGSSASMVNQATAATQMGEAQARAIEAGGAIDVAKQMQHTTVLDAFNASITNPDNAIVSAQRQRTEAIDTMNSLRGKIDAEDQVTPWDDPLRWVVNQFTLPPLKLAYNAAHAKNKEMVQQITDTQNRVNAQASIDVAPILDLTRQKAAEDAQATQFKALVETNAALSQSQHITAQMLMQKMQLGQQEIQNNFEFSRLYAQTFALTSSDREDKATQPVVDALNVKRAAVGADPYKPGEFRQLSSPERSRLTEIAKIGGSIGSNPGETYKIMGEWGALNTLSDTNPTVYNLYAGLVGSKEYAGVLKTVNNNPKFVNLGMDEKRIEVFKTLALKQQDDIGQANNSNNTLPDSNVYKLKLLNTTMYPELKANLFVAMAADSAAMAPDKKAKDEDMLLGLLGKIEANPTQKIALINQFSEFYRLGSKLQWERSGAKLVGYPPPVGYGISGVLTNVTGEAVQTYNPASVEHWVTVNMAERRKLTDINTLFNAPIPRGGPLDNAIPDTIISSPVPEIDPRSPGIGRGSPGTPSPGATKIYEEANRNLLHPFNN